MENSQTTALHDSRWRDPVEQKTCPWYGANHGKFGVIWAWKTSKKAQRPFWGRRWWRAFPYWNPCQVGGFLDIIQYQYICFPTVCPHLTSSGFSVSLAPLYSTGPLPCFGFPGQNWAKRLITPLLSWSFSAHVPPITAIVPGQSPCKVPLSWRFSWTKTLLFGFLGEWFTMNHIAWPSLAKFLKRKCSFAGSR